MKDTARKIIDELKAAHKVVGESNPAMSDEECIRVMNVLYKAHDWIVLREMEDDRKMNERLKRW